MGKAKCHNCRKRMRRHNPSQNDAKTILESIASIPKNLRKIKPMPHVLVINSNQVARMLKVPAMRSIIIRKLPEILGRLTQKPPYLISDSTFNGKPGSKQPVAGTSMRTLTSLGGDGGGTAGGKL
jgi:hypothetical protein